MPFIRTGDRMMPSLALTAAKFAAKHGFGTFGENLFANVVVDPSKKDGKSIVVYYDPDDEGRDGGTVRTLASGPTWYIDRLILSASGGDTATVTTLLRKHVNFLCSVRSIPVFVEEDQTWYRILHVVMLGRPRRPGRTTAGMELYETTLRVMWRPMSAQDPDYATVTGIEEM